MPTLEQRRYAAKLNQIAQRYGTMEDATAREINKMLVELRRQIAADLVTAQDYNALRLGELDRNLAQYIDEFNARAAALVQKAGLDAAAAGTASVIDPIRSAGISAVFNKPTLAQLNVAQGFGADLIRDISDDMYNQINRQLQQAVVGIRPPAQVMQDITRILGTEAGPRQAVHGIAARAETITRTELQRAFNLSAYSQQQALAQAVPELKKAWIATADKRTRESHLRAHQQYRSNPIPISEYFILRDERGEGRLLYCGDPEAPARFTVNCRCRTVTIHPTIGVLSSSLDGRIAAEIKRRDEAL